MARVLIVGCGCRGQALARELVARGHAARGTTRARARLEAVRAAGAEPFLGDPDRIGTLMAALEGVTIVCWLLGSARGSLAQLEALHGDRLRMLFQRLVDTPVRGVVYEGAGSAGSEVLAGGVEVARGAERTWAIPVTVLAADPAHHARWHAAAWRAVEGLLGG